MVSLPLSSRFFSLICGQREKSRARIRNFAGRWRNNSAWPRSLLVAIACAIVPGATDWQVPDVRALALIAGCIVTAIRRVQRSARRYDIAEMDPIARERLFGFRHAFDSPVTLWITIAVIAALFIRIRYHLVAAAGGRTSDKLHDELVKRVVSWAVMTPLLLGPVLLGAAWTILAVAILSVLCYREFARATGFFRYRSLSICVVLGIIATTFAIADHWYGLFVAIPPLTMVLLAMVAVLRDEPRGYTQRVGLGVIGFLLFGHCLGHLGYMANDADFRPIVMLIILTVELNDVFAYITGNTFGHRKITPNTSPSKTLGGALGALVF